MSFENQNNKVMPAGAFTKTNTSNTDKNMSGKGSSYPVPDSVAKRFNWGAFALDWIWGLGNKSYITLITLPLWFLCFVPQISILAFILSIGLSVWFGIKGNEWAWQNKHFNSIDAFNNYQKKWAIAGIIYIVINLIFVIFSIIAFAALAQNIQLTAATNYIESARSVIATRIESESRINEVNEKQCNLSSVGLAEYFENDISYTREDNILKDNTWNSTLTFKGNGICKNSGDCSVTIRIVCDGKIDIGTIPLYANSRGFVYVKEADINAYINK